MNRRTFLALAVSAALAGAATLVSPVRADTVSDLVALIQEAGNSPNPAMAFIKGVGTLGDFSLTQAQVREALRQAGAPQGGMIDKLLRPVTSLEKRGKNIRIKRSQVTKLSPLKPDGTGAVEVGTDVSATVEVRGPHDAVLDDVSGIKVGHNADELYAMKNVRFTRENGRPVAKVTAGFLMFSDTVTIDLSPPRATTRPSNTNGLTGNLPRN
jgi:hypothetical protein